MTEVPGVDSNDHLRMKVNQFNSRVEYAATSHFDSWQSGGDDTWSEPKISIKDAGNLQTSADNTYRDLIENKISVDEAYAGFNALEQQRAELTPYTSAELLSDDPNAITSDYYNLKTSEFHQDNSNYVLQWDDDEDKPGQPLDCSELNHTSTGISKGVESGDITPEQANALLVELKEHRDNLKKLTGHSLSEEEKAQCDAINSRLAEMQDECGYVKPATQTASKESHRSSSTPSEQKNTGPKKDDSKNSPIITGLAVLAMAALALLALLFFPIALPVIVGTAALAAAGTIAYRHGPEIMSAFTDGAPTRSASPKMNNDAPNMENDAPEVENEIELDADFDAPEVENEEELEVDINEEPEIEPVVEKPDADIEQSIPKQALNDSPTQTKGDDLKDALHQIPEASPEKSSETQHTQDNEDDYDSSSSMKL